MPRPQRTMNEGPFIPVWLDDRGLSKDAFRVACHLWRRRNRKSGQCNPSIDSIGETCRMNRRQVLRALTELEGHKLMARRKQGYGKTNSYTLYCPSSGVDSAPIDTSQSAPNQHHQSVSNPHPFIGVESAPQRYSMKVNNRRESHSPKKSLKSPKPNLDEWLEYASSIKWPRPDAERAFDYYEANGWVQASGQPIIDWQAAARACMKRNRDSGNTRNPARPSRLPDNLRSQTTEQEARVAEPLNA